MADAIAEANRLKKERTWCATFELTSLMSQEAASILTPNGAMNPAYLACTGGLLALVIYCWWFDANVVLALVGVMVCVALLYLGQRWGTIAEKRLYNTGWNAMALPEDARRMQVTVDDTGIEVRRGTGQVEKYEFSQVAHVRTSPKLIVLTLRGGGSLTQRGLILIPRKALSETRFRALTVFLLDHTGRAKL